MTLAETIPMTDTTAPSPARSIVFVDSRVQDAATLLQGFPPGAEVVYLKAGEDGLAQMAAALGEQGDVGAVHVLAHGSAGQLWLGTTFLDASTLAGQADALAALGEASPLMATCWSMPATWRVARWAHSLLPPWPN